MITKNKSFEYNNGIFTLKRVGVVFPIIKYSIRASEEGNFGNWYTKYVMHNNTPITLTDDELDDLNEIVDSFFAEDVLPLSSEIIVAYEVYVDGHPKRLCFTITSDEALNVINGIDMLEHIVQTKGTTATVDTDFFSS